MKRDRRLFNEEVDCGAMFMVAHEFFYCAGGPNHEGRHFDKVPPPCPICAGYDYHAEGCDAEGYEPPGETWLTIYWDSSTGRYEVVP